MESPERKLNRLKNYDYSRNGLYFITICTKDRIHYFSEIIEEPSCVGADIIRPKTVLTNIGKILDDSINDIKNHYDNISVVKYCIMPDHLHMIIYLFDDGIVLSGTSRTPSPTNAVIPSIVSTLKRFVNKKIGFNTWQRSFHDHIIRNEKEFLEICDYIDNNPINWVNDIYNQNYWR
jgi:REP element-mobilizing transposase RayT